MSPPKAIFTPQMPHSGGKVGAIGRYRYSGGLGFKSGLASFPAELSPAAAEYACFPDTLFSDVEYRKATAQDLWKDPDLLEIQAKSEDERRFLVISRIDATHWSAVVTYRNGRIPLSSVRRSREKEVELNES